MDKFLRTAHEARENGLDELDRKIRGQEESIKNMAEVIRAQAAAIKQDNDSFKGWMDLVENLEGELQVVKGQVASLSDRVCHCGDVDAAERVPTPALSYESYHSPPVASPRENEIPLAVVMANTVLEEDSENVAPPIEVEDGEVAEDRMVDGTWTHGEAERILRDIEASYRQDIVRKSCFVSNFFIYSFNFYSPFAALPLYFANSHIPLYLSILFLMITGKTNKKRVYWRHKSIVSVQAFSLA
jgi:hypothetical protein